MTRHSDFIQLAKTYIFARNEKKILCENVSVKTVNFEYY